VNTTEFQELMNENLAQPDTSLVFRGIVPPGNIESDLDRYQARLFARTGDPAIRYLSPFAPVAKTEPDEVPLRLQTTGALSYLAPSPELYRHPFGVLIFPATLLYASGKHELAPVVLGISTLSPELLQPEIAALTHQPLESRSGYAHSECWSFAVSKTVQITLTWLWESTEKQLDVDLGGNYQSPLTTDRELLGVLQQQGRP